MKKILFVLAFAITSAALFSQTLPANVKTKEYYLTKSKHQRKTALIMLYGGAGLTALGVVLTGLAIENNSKGRSDNIGYVGVSMTYVGVLSAFGSIPFFISAAHNRHKAAELSLNLQTTPTLYTTGYLMAVRQPAITLEIPL
jgi:hypothetical protein